MSQSIEQSKTLIHYPEYDETLLDWHSLSTGHETKIRSSSFFVALGLNAIMNSLRSGKDLDFVGTPLLIKGHTIQGIRRDEVQGFRESITYTLNENHDV